MIREIGMAAGTIWNLLKKDGETNITQLQKKTGLPQNQLYLALGWLAREDKIQFRRDRRAIFIGLKE